MNKKAYYDNLLNNNTTVRTIYINPNLIDRILITEFFDEVTLPNGDKIYFDSLTEPSRSNKPWVLLKEELEVAEEA